MSLGSRIGTMKALAESLQKLVSIEREAFGLNEDKPQGDFLTRIVMVPVKDAA